MKIAVQNIIKFMVILFLKINGAMLLSTGINQDNVLNRYNIEILPLPYYAQEGGKSNPLLLKNSELALTKEASRWAMGIVHYFVDVTSYDFLVSYQIRSAMNILESSTCIKFSPLLVKPPGNESYIHITNQNKERDCNHEPWYKETGEVVLILGYDCLSNGNILHSLLHALGLKDAVTHPQRDKYIRVIWNNIQPAYRHLYNIQEDPSAAVEYDPMSIMHFSDRDFTVNGQATIEPVVSGLVINPSESLSPLDKLRLRLLFGHVCNRREVHNIFKTCHSTLKRNEAKKELITEDLDIEILKDTAKEPKLNEEENESKSDESKDGKDSVKSLEESKSKEKRGDINENESNNSLSQGDDNESVSEGDDKQDD